MNKKERILRISTFLSIFILSTTIFVYAAGDVFSAGEQLVNDVRTFLLKISTGIAIIGIGFGLFKLAFSSGDVQAIATGKKAIMSSIVGWGVLNGAMLILNTIKNYL